MERNGTARRDVVEIRSVVGGLGGTTDKCLLHTIRIRITFSHQPGVV